MAKTKSSPAATQRETPGNDRRPIANPNSVGQAIQQAQNGRVNVTPARAIEMAGTLFSQGKFGQAEKVCRQVIEARPGSADAHNILGVTLNALGRGVEGVEMLRRAIKLEPKAANVHANLGEVLRQQGQTDEAAKALEDAVKLEPNNAQALNN